MTSRPRGSGNFPARLLHPWASKFTSTLSRVKNSEDTKMIELAVEVPEDCKKVREMKRTERIAPFTEGRTSRNTRLGRGPWFNKHIFIIFYTFVTGFTSIIYLSYLI
jgi:hypothetical protein